MVRGRRWKLRRARELRRAATAAEQKAWELLRDRRLLGLKFRRQHRLFGFIADFYCHELQLVLEIDGGIHTTPRRASYDAWRDAILRGHGLEVIRISNEDVSRERLLAITFPLSTNCGEGDRG